MSFNAFEQMLLLFLKHRLCILRLPLERGKRFRNKGSDAYIDRNRLAFRSVGIFIICIYNCLCKVSYALNILKRFGGQAHHKVELNGSPTACKRFFGSSYNLALCYILIDCVTKSLRACFGCKSKTASTHLFKFLHKFVGEVVNTK